MATVVHTQERPIDGEPTFLLVKWNALANGDDGSSFTLAQYADRSVQIAGTFGASGTLVFEGTIDGTNYNTLNDPQGNALTFTTSKIEAISELVIGIRPKVTAGDGATSLNVSMIVRKPR